MFFHARGEFGWYHEEIQPRPFADGGFFLYQKEMRMFDKIQTPTTVETGSNEPEKAILVSVVLEDGDLMDPDSSLDELEELLQTAGGVLCYGQKPPQKNIAQKNGSIKWFWINGQS